MDLSPNGMSYCPSAFEITQGWVFVISFFTLLYALIAIAVKYALHRFRRCNNQVKPFKVLLGTSWLCVVGSIAISSYSLVHATSTVKAGILNEVPASIGMARLATANVYQNLSTIMTLITLSLVTSSLLLLVVTVANAIIDRTKRNEPGP